MAILVPVCYCRRRRWSRDHSFTDDPKHRVVVRVKVDDGGELKVETKVFLNGNVEDIRGMAWIWWYMCWILRAKGESFQPVF